MFYTNVFKRGNKLFLKGYDKGLRVNQVIDYKPYLFLPNANGTYQTIKGEKVEKKEFDSMSSARDFIEQYKDVSNFKYYGITNFEYLYINDNFKGDIDYNVSWIKVGNIDIECAADEGFPDITQATKEITAITLRCRGRNYVFGCGDFTTDDVNTHYLKCKDEYDLLISFLDCWEKLDLDIVSGWNIEFFDFPYLINRMKNLFDSNIHTRLSPWKTVNEKITKHYAKEQQTYTIAGVSILDYYQLYRKFTFGNQESYKLDFIAELEVGEKKIDYKKYGSLINLYRNNYQKFIEYNIHDVILVDKIDNKLKFLEQVMALAYDAKVNYIDTLTTVRPWDIIIHNYLMESRIVVPQMETHYLDRALIGGHVKEPIPGLYKWVVSIDLNSLYPHLIMQYNISPETFVSRMSEDLYPSMSDLISGNTHDMSLYAWTANGCAYRKDKQGFLPYLMETMYNDRVKYKKMMIEAKKKFEKTKSSDDEMLIARYHNMQLAKKIQLNSAYGALGNEYFRWFNFNHAEAITSSGQLSIRWIERKMNEYMNKLLNTKDIDYVIASDTDSIYITFDKLIEKFNLTDDLTIVKALDEFFEKRIQPYINKSYEELAAQQNAYAQKMFMKRETIANKGLWTGKKRYILNAWNVEGVQYDKPKIKITGIEAVRSSTPGVCRKKIKECLSIIMNGNQEELHSYIQKFKEEFSILPFEDVAFPRSVNDMDKYKDDVTIYKKGSPIHVKGSLLFNELLRNKGIKTIPPLRNGDKIRFAYLMIPNPIKDTVIACGDILPEEFLMDEFIDRDTQFQKAFIEPLNKIVNVVGWTTERRLTLFG